MTEQAVTNRLGEIRRELPAVTNIVYLNTGTVGPFPLRSAQAMKELQQEELHQGRIGAQAYQRKRALKAEVREALANLLHAAPEEVALTQNTTEGVNLVVSGFNWQSGDEVITTNVEHGAVLLPLYAIRDRYGVTVKHAEAGEGLLERVAGLISEKTRLIAVSHVSYSTGEVLPIAELAVLAHRFNIPVLVDGAQSFGAIPVNVKQLDVDYYSVPGQKWQLGPEGTGALYISKERLSELQQTFAGYGSVSSFEHGGGYRLHEEARRFEVSSVFIPALAGLKESIRWFHEQVGAEWAFARVKKLGERLRTELAGLDGVEVITPLSAAGLTSFRLAGSEPAQVVERLASRGIIVRTIAELNAVRAAVGFFNTEEEIELLTREIAQARNLS